MRRLWIGITAACALGLLAAGLVWSARSLSGSRLDRWHPGSSGDVIVLEKILRGDRCALRVRLEVPPASPAEAALIPSGLADRAARLGARSFDLEVPVARVKWEVVEPGARIRGVYHLNVGRTEAFVATLYLDALAAPRQK